MQFHCILVTTFFEGLFTPSVGLSYTSYKLSPDAETNNLTTLLVGANLRPFRVLSFDLTGTVYG